MAFPHCYSHLRYATEQVVQPVFFSVGLADQLLTDKGMEMILTSFVCNHARQLAPRATPRAPHRVVPSTRNGRIETFWGQVRSATSTRHTCPGTLATLAQVNVRINLPSKLMFLSMENAGILDVGVAYHVGALQALMPAIMQYALDELRAAWNAHYVHSRYGISGRPNDLFVQAPNPLGPAFLPLGYDAVAEYEQVRARGRSVGVQSRSVGAQ